MINLSLIFTMIVATIVFVIFLLFTIKVPLAVLEIVKLVVAGILFIFACGCGLQVGYDKVIKKNRKYYSITWWLKCDSVSL